MKFGATPQGAAPQAQNVCKGLPSPALSLSPLLAFVVLAFSWSWGVGLGAQYAMPLSPVFGTILAMVSGFGPSIASISVVASISTNSEFRTWLAGCLSWRIDWRWYAVAFGLPPAIMLAALALHGALGGALPASPATGHITIAVANFGLILLVGGPLGEEFGWRGYALPALTVRFNWRIASLLVGFLWALWHLPLFFMVGTLQSHLPFLLFLISTIAESVMFGWLARNTGNSVVPAMVMHTSINAWMNIIPVLPNSGSLQPLTLMIGIEAIIALALLVSPRLGNIKDDYSVNRSFPRSPAPQTAEQSPLGGPWPTVWYGPLALAAVPATALTAGLVAMALAPGQMVYWIFAAGVIPVLGALLVSIFRSLARREFGLDIVAALSMSGALLANEALAGVVVALMYSGGQLLENYAQGRAQREMTALLGRVARTAQVYRGSTLIETPIESLVPGNRLLIRASEIVPADGRVHTGEAMLDESSLTGEPIPVHRSPTDTVASGVANAGAPFDLVVERTAANSTYAGVVRLVDAARFSKAPVARLADQYALGFLGVTLVLAVGAWVLTEDPVRAVAVLVVATPCPLILAVPVAIVAGMSRAAKRGLLFKSAGILEILPRIRTVLIDKTGTVTDGYPRVSAVEPGAGTAPEKLILLSASLAQASQHTISRALVAEARKRGIALTPPTDVQDVPGDGVKGKVGGSMVVIGRPDFVVAFAGQVSASSEKIPSGATILAVAIDGAVAGRVVFQDKLRDDAPATVAALRRGGVTRIVLLTGDQRVVARDIGKRLGADEVIAQATPQQKIDAVQSAKARGPVMMVGDGINDAPALAAADVGVAMGARGAAAAAEAADIVMLVDRVDRLADAMDIARHTRAVALQSVLVGLGLSSCGMLLAAFGYLPPLAGALAQEAIDVAVVLNALRALGGDPGRTERASA